MNQLLLRKLEQNTSDRCLKWMNTLTLVVRGQFHSGERVQVFATFIEKVIPSSEEL